MKTDEPWSCAVHMASPKEVDDSENARDYADRLNALTNP